MRFLTIGTSLPPACTLLICCTTPAAMSCIPRHSITRSIVDLQTNIHAHKTLQQWCDYNFFQSWHSGKERHKRAVNLGSISGSITPTRKMTARRRIMPDLSNAGWEQQKQGSSALPHRVNLSRCCISTDYKGSPAVGSRGDILRRPIAVQKHQQTSTPAECLCAAVRSRS